MKRTVWIQEWVSFWALSQIPHGPSQGASHNITLFLKDRASVNILNVTSMHVVNEGK